MENRSKKQIVNDYRKSKKINKSKIRDGKRVKEFLLDDSSILNSLPCGAFDKKLSKNNNLDKKEELIEEYEEKSDIINNEYKNEDEEEYEEFNDDYFKQETI